MPRVNIYIRKEDEISWNAIDNKPEWLHSALRGKWYKGDTSARDAILTTMQPAPPKCSFCDDYHFPNDHQYLPGGEYAHSKQIKSAQEGMVLENLSLCQHYQPRGKCLVKGCKE